MEWFEFSQPATLSPVQTRCCRFVPSQHATAAATTTTTSGFGGGGAEDDADPAEATPHTPPPPVLCDGFHLSLRAQMDAEVVLDADAVETTWACTYVRLRGPGDAVPVPPGAVRSLPV
jgi:hypothetical protein